MTRRLALRLLVAVCAGVLIPAGCGGGGSSSDPTFRVTGVAPDTSVDLNGGDTVTVFGERFLDVNVVNVRFGGTPATNLQLIGQNSLTVVTPPAPGGIAQVVTIEVVSTLGGSKFLAAAYTYVESQVGPPDVQSMTPTAFTPTGAEGFSIGGSSLGSPGGTVSVLFQAVGTVSGLVSQTGTFTAGNAPLTGAPPASGVTVTLDNGVGTDDAPSPVTYVWGAPMAQPVAGGHLSSSPAGIPVRVSEDHAVFCSPGPDATWRTFDDQLWHVFRPVGGGFLVSELLFNGVSVGFLDPDVSVPAVLDANSFVVYWLGVDGIHSGVNRLANDGFLHVGSLRSTAPGPVVSRAPCGFIALQCPLVAISSTRTLITSAGPNGATVGTPDGDDELVLVDWTNPAAPGGPPPLRVGYLDNTVPPNNISVPFSADGETVFVGSLSVDGLRNSGDDRLFQSTVTTMTQTPGSTPNSVLLGVLGTRPIALSGTLAAALGSGTDNTPGTVDDTLSLFNVSGGLSRTNHQLSSVPQLANALRPLVAGPGGEALVPLRGASILPFDGDEKLAVYTNPLAGTASTIDVRGPAQVMSLSTLEAVVFDSGLNLAPGVDDVIRYLDASFTSVQVFARRLNWTQTAPILGDDLRVFAVGAGADNTGNTGDETLQVWQTRALGATDDAVVLPLSTGLTTPVPLTVPFVPVAPDWGVVISPGLDKVFSGAPADDLLIIARY